MTEMLELLLEIKRDVQGLNKTLAHFSKTHAQRLKEEWIKMEDVQKMLGCSRSFIYHLIELKEIRCSKIGGLVYFKTSDLESILNWHYNNPLKK